MTDAPVLATLRASPPRRAIGLVMVFALGAILVWIALARPPAAFGWRLFLLGGGVLALYTGERMRRMTRRHLVLTADALRDDQGTLLARVEDVRSVDRGTFAFKPSSGFLLRLTRRQGRAWAPGLWWRIGRSVGVGGVTVGNEAKYMAEVIAALLAERARPESNRADH